MPAELQMVIIPKIITYSRIMKVIKLVGKMADCSVKVNNDKNDKYKIQYSEVLNAES